jgi:transposase
MESYSKAAMERAMKAQEVILRAMAKKITWWQAAEIIGISDHSMRRWRERLEEFGYDGLFDRRRARPSPKRVPVATVEQVLGCTASSTSISTCKISTRRCFPHASLSLV